MRRTMKITASLFAVGLLLVLSPLRGEERQETKDGPKEAVAVAPAEQRNTALREVDARLRQRQWAEAHALASRFLETWRGSLVEEIGSALGRALMGLALAEAGLGREAEALWSWQEAQNVGGPGLMGEVDLSRFGPPGELLAAHRLRWWDEAPRGMTVLAAHELGPEGTPPRQISGGDMVLAGPLATIAIPKWAWIQVVVDKDGRVVEPVVLASPLAGVKLAALEAVRDWRFEPARRGGEPVAVYHEITLPPRGEVPLRSLLDDRRLRKAHDRLLAGNWEGARKLARESWRDTAGSDYPNAARSLALTALADAGLGEKEEAICRWRVAQFASPDLYQADLSHLGTVGQMLEDHPWGAELVRPARPRPAPAAGEAEDQGKGGAKPPRKIAGGPPLFPGAARAAGVRGRAVIDAAIDEAGRVTGVRLRENLPYGLDLAAMDAVCGWRFTPATHGGKPVRVDYTLIVHFAVER